MAFKHGSDPLDYKGGGASERPGAELSESGAPMDTSVYPGSQGSGLAHGHSGHKHGGSKHHGHHPTGHVGKKGKY
jgi:hypothetical protein